MSKTSSQATTNPIKEEWNKRKADKAARKAARGPFNLAVFLKTWLVRLFHTAFILMISYLVVMLGTLLIPTVMGYIIGSMGYTLENNAEMLLSLFSGLFFTGWILIGSFFVLKFSWKRYISNIKKTLPEQAAKNLE